VSKAYRTAHQLFYPLSKETSYASLRIAFLKDSKSEKNNENREAEILLVHCLWSG
jgi:hypothetical protein